MKKINTEKDKPKNDVHYFRVSSNEQVLGFSLDNQEKFCREFSEREGYKVFGIFREEGESAKNTNRTQLQLMMRYCEKHRKQIARVVIYKVDRMSRVVGDYFALKVFFNKLGISVVSATEKLEDTPGGKFYETLLSAAAEFDNNVRSQRTIEGMRARFLKGAWSGKAPWGYMNTTDKLNNKIIAPDPEKAPAIRMIFEKYATGKYTFEEIATMINKMGLKSRHGMNISKQLVSKITVNHIYYGMIIIPKFEIVSNGLHEPIITKELFEKARLVKNGFVENKLPYNRDNEDFPLRGIKCKGCGGSITGGITKGRNNYYNYYGCYKKECIMRTSISKKDFEDEFTKLLLDLTPNNEFFECLKEAIRIAHKTELESVTETEGKIRRRVIEIEANKKKLLKMRMDREITSDEFVSYNEEYSSELVSLSNSLITLAPPELEVESVVETGIEFLKHLPDNWRSLNVKDLRVLRNLLFPQNLEYTYPGIKTDQLSPIYKLKSLSDEENYRLVWLSGFEPELRVPQTLVLTVTL